MPNLSKDVFEIKKVKEKKKKKKKNTVPQTYVMNDLHDEENAGRFY